MAQNDKTLWGVQDTEAIFQYPVTRETDNRYYIKGGYSSYVAKDRMNAYHGENYFLTAREAVQFVVDRAYDRILRAQQVIAREEAAIAKYQPLLDGTEPVDD